MVYAINAIYPFINAMNVILIKFANLAQVQQYCLIKNVCNFAQVGIFIKMILINAYNVILRNARNVQNRTIHVQIVYKNIFKK